jgi:hypothetical protein
MVPLLVGIALFVAGMLMTSSKNIGGPALPGLLVVMIGLVVGGPWLTSRAARLLPRLTSGASPIFAARRIADNPAGAFRSVSGLVLAVFLGTMLAALLPAIDAVTATPSARAMSNVLLDGFEAGPVCGNAVNCTGSSGPEPEFGPKSASGSAAASNRITRMALEGLPPAAGARLVRELSAFRQATTVAVYSLPQDGTVNYLGPNTAVVSCAGMQAIHALGTCAPGLRYVDASAGSLYGDNPHFTSEPIVGDSSPAYKGNLQRLYLQAVLIKVPNQAVLERVRTFLITHTRESVSGTAPRTFGEAVQARLGVATTAQRLIDIAVALTLLVAGCSLAVSAGGGLVERKRPFSMLRLSGTPTSTLYLIVLTEAVLPLVAAFVVAAGVAYGFSLLTINRMAPAGTPIPSLGHVYYLTMGAGLAVALLIILATLPLLNRITGLENVRFE